MTENTKIEWAHHTFNPWIGCTKVGPGCDHCYAEAMDHRFGGGHWGPGAPRKRTSDSNWKQPLRWNRRAEKEGTRYRVFCASLADVFDNEIDPQWRHDLFALIKDTPNLDWLLLTKRIGQATKLVDPGVFEDLPNIWLGATIVNQEEAGRDIPKLLRVPARVRFLSMEPLLGPVNLTNIELLGGFYFLDALNRRTWRDVWSEEWAPEVTGEPLEESIDAYQEETGGPYPPTDDAPTDLIDWVIAGGESGPRARPMHPEWVRSLRDQCQAAGVPFFFKQWGEWAPPEAMDGTTAYADAAGKFTLRCLDPEIADHFSHVVSRVGKKRAGRLLDGREWNEVPA